MSEKFPQMNLAEAVRWSAENQRRATAGLPKISFRGFCERRDAGLAAVEGWDDPNMDPEDVSWYQERAVEKAAGEINADPSTPAAMGFTMPPGVVCGSCGIHVYHALLYGKSVLCPDCAQEIGPQGPWPARDGLDATPSP